MTFLFPQRLRTWWETRRREHIEKEEEELAAEARGDAYGLGRHKDSVLPGPRGIEVTPPRRGSDRDQEF